MLGQNVYGRVLRVSIVLTLVIASLVGCGGSERPSTIPISGRVTINGQPPGENGRLHFQPIQVAAGYAKRPAGGSFTAEGTYRVMSWEPDDGLVPGHYTVSLMPSDPANTKIPAKYREAATSGLEVDVPIDESQVEYNIDVLSK